jgi:hypothetical protein
VECRYGWDLRLQQRRLDGNTGVKGQATRPLLYLSLPPAPLGSQLLQQVLSLSQSPLPRFRFLEQMTTQMLHLERQLSEVEHAALNCPEPSLAK